MDKKVISAALAGLLHDIGKIEQRAREEPWKPPEGYEREGQPVHARWSEQFIAENVPAAYRPAALQGVYHHQPEKSPAEDKRLSLLVALADKLSAGERADEIKEEKGQRPPQQMVSIYDRVGSHRENARSGNHYLPLGSLALDKRAIFPAGKMDENETRQAYEDLAQKLREVARAGISNGESYLENLLYGLQRHAWSVPSAYYHSLPDVSLYDHARMTAALAVCLSEFSTQAVENLLGAVRSDFAKISGIAQNELLEEPVALLVGGDISGIQSFIYTLSARGAAKTLRGRSFYLQLLNEAILRYVLSETGIPACNVIYSGGGHFFLLAPLSAANKLEEVQRQITRVLLKHHGISLYVALGWIEVPARGFKIGHFPAYWDRMHAELGRAKQRRYQELGEEFYPLVFEPQAHGGNQEKTCSVCGEEREDTQKLREEGEEAEGQICSLCNSFVNALGRRLPDAGYVYLTLGDPEGRQPGTAMNVLAEFGMGVQLIDRNKRPLPDVRGLDHPERGVLWALGDSQGWPSSNSVPTALALRYTVNQVPQMTFDQLQEKSTGIKRLGVLRMDVDDLGTLFKTGFGEGERSIATVARLSTLSFQLSLFFEGWVKHICEQTSRDIYAVYSGGDDLFLIAPWHLVPDLGMLIKSDFESYTSCNPSLHISGGMAFIHGKYPVYQAAKDAFDALDLAKSQPGKQSFTFLGQAWSWQEFKELHEKYQRLVEIDQKLSSPRSLLQLLQRLSQPYQLKSIKLKGKPESERPLWGSWMWVGDYQFVRMIELARKDAELKDALQAIYDDLSPFYTNLPVWGKAARWAQLYVRKEKSEKESLPLP